MKRGEEKRLRKTTGGGGVLSSRQGTSRPPSPSSKYTLPPPSLLPNAARAHITISNAPEPSNAINKTRGSDGSDCVPATFNVPAPVTGAKSRRGELHGCCALRIHTSAYQPRLMLARTSADCATSLSQQSHFLQLALEKGLSIAAIGPRVPRALPRLATVSRRVIGA